MVEAMRPLGLAGYSEAGLIHVPDRRDHHARAHDIGEANDPPGAVPPDPGNGFGGQAPELIGLRSRIRCSGNYWKAKQQGCVWT
jgi:hypothetical protein